VKKALPALAFLALCQGAFAQQPPTGGSLQVPSAPALPRAAPGIRIEQGTPAAAAAAGAVQERIVVQRLRITGASLYPESDLLALTGFVPGSQLSLADLQAMAARITDHYRRNGYFVAQAFLPAQDIKDGVVAIAVSEGRLGKVDVRNSTNLSASVPRNALDGLNPGDPLTMPALESGLLLLSDVPGVNVNATLVPGGARGTSDLVVNVTPGQRISGEIDFDNAGNRYTGEYRLGATVNLNNPLGLGDVASLRALTSGSGLNYLRGSYQLQAGRGTVGLSYSRLEYKLGREFEPLRAHGTADIASVFGRYPLQRSRNNNVYAQLGLDFKHFRDYADAVPSTSERHSRVLMGSLFGDHRDDFGGGGLSSYFVTLSLGQLDIDTPAVRASDALTARTEGGFQKLNFSVIRVQRLGGPFSAYAGLSGQLASRNLDVSEKMELGGMNAVRAYPEGEAYADQGAVLTLEGRMDLPRLYEAMPGQMQLVAFADAGVVTSNRKPWTTGDNSRTLSGAGVGISWADPGNFLARAFYARKLGNEPAQSAPDRSGRFWFQLVKYF
jgi:hemolysin activation/secretion protein